MDAESRKRQSEAEAGLQEIPNWARRYAQNRTLRMVVFSGIFIAGAALFAGLGHLAAWALRSGSRPLMWASLAVLCICIGWWLWFAFFSGPRIIRRITERLYRGEGSVSMGGAPDTELPRVPNLAIGLLILLASAQMLLTHQGLVPERYVQPVSALYVIPFMLWVGLKLHPQPQSPFVFLWPVLYVIHGALILAGVPISRGLWFDIFVPVVGYGFIAALAGHIYSRFALRRLRALSASPGASDQHEGENDGRA